MKLHASSFLPALLVLTCIASVANADQGPNRGGFQYGDGGAVPGANDSLYRDLGGKEHIAAFTNDFVDILLADDRIKNFFSESNIDRLREKLIELFIDLSGGPVKYTGHTEAQAHKALGIKNGDFNALVEDLQTALDHAKIPFATQNRLLALLAPMQRDVVTK